MQHEVSTESRDLFRGNSRSVAYCCAARIRRRATEGTSNWVQERDEYVHQQPMGVGELAKNYLHNVWLFDVITALHPSLQGARSSANTK